MKKISCPLSTSNWRVKMKNKIIAFVLLIILSVSMTGCGNRHSKTLNCTATNSSDGRTTTSDLKVKVENNEVKDMTLTLNVVLPDDQQFYKQSMIYQMRQKTDRVYATDNGIKAIFGMGSSYFDTFGITTGASYGELKQVLELQGYTCKE